MRIIFLILLLLFGCGVAKQQSNNDNDNNTPPSQYGQGWTPPMPVEERQHLYGDADESLKAQAPQLFEIDEQH